MGPNPTKTTTTTNQQNPSILPKLFFTWDLQICSTSLIVFFSLIVLLVCFIYFDLVQFSSTLGGFFLNINIPTIRTISETLGRHENVNHLSGTIPAPPEPQKSIASKSPTITTNTGLINQSTQFDHRSVPRDDDSTEFPNSLRQSSIGKIENKTASDNQTINELKSFLNDSIAAGAGKTRSIGGCDLYNGSWVRDESYPLYLPNSCPFIDGGFNCQENGRPDQDYLKWRWEPSECDIPRFNGEKLLESLRGKRLVFVGDSIGRNQWESMLCLLANGVKNKTRIYEINGEPITKHKGFLVFRFESYDFHIEYYRSPFLVPQTRPPKNAPEGVKTVLKVDTMDWTSARWVGAHAIIFNAGHWWSYEKTIRGGCYFQVGEHVNKSMDVKDGFEKMMHTWRHWVATHVDLTKTKVFFRTYAPVHFSGGTWKTGGQCHTETEPFGSNMTFEGQPWTNKVIIGEVQKLKGANLIDITHLSNFRRDAHPSIYNVNSSVPRSINRQDCSHWCLPGLPDTWNELLHATIANMSS